MREGQGKSSRFLDKVSDGEEAQIIGKIAKILIPRVHTELLKKRRGENTRNEHVVYIKLFREFTLREGGNVGMDEKLN